jgi:two-component system, NtrC family, sensor histidine kinase GlrK
MLFRTRSILQLTTLGFLAVAALLLSALLMSAQQLDRLTAQGQLTVNQSASAMRLSRQLIEHSSALERSARQFLVLRDPGLLNVYDTRRSEFHNAITQLLQPDTSAAMQQQARTLRDTENGAFTALNAATSASGFEYPQLIEAAYELSRLTSAWVDARASELREQTIASQAALNIRTLMLVSTALLLAVLFVVLITRPLRQLDRAITDLGAGSYDAPIEIGGPRDLQELGQRLDWLRDRLQQLEQQRSDFLRHVSHELKTPLAAMQESAALLADGIAGPVSAEQQTLIRILSNNCKRLLDLIEALLRHNAGSFAVLDAPPTAIRLNKLIRELVQSQQLAIRTAGLRIELRLSNLAVYSDQERIRVILDNLLSNAVKFSPEGGLIRISLYRDHSHDQNQKRDLVAVEIHDEGPGVSEAEKDKIFTAFYQGSACAREHFHSTGLGLAIAREYAQAAGGTLELVPSNSGACFRLTLPHRRN